MVYFREFYRSRFAQILTYLPQYFSTSGTVILRNTSNIVLIISDLIFTLDLTILTRELSLPHSKKERRISSI